ncbi:MAG TPA: hypothetical protein VNE42_05200 [Acidimicrobiales bacterium]|nr:hypothetical protein [Acidimicrobiales bacterium]
MAMEATKTTESAVVLNSGTVLVWLVVVVTVVEGELVVVLVSVVVEFGEVLVVVEPVMLVIGRALLSCAMISAFGTGVATVVPSE